MSFRVLDFATGKLFAPDSTSNTPTGHMNAQRIDRNFVSTWEMITQKHFEDNNNVANQIGDGQYGGGIGPHRSSNITNLLVAPPTYTNFVDYDFAQLSVIYDGVFNLSPNLNSTARQNMGFRWNIYSSNDTLINATGTLYTRKGFTGQNTNTSISGGSNNIMADKMIPTASYSYNNNDFTSQPASGVPFRMEFHASNWEGSHTNNTNYLVTRCLYNFVNNNGVCTGYEYGFAQAFGNVTAGQQLIITGATMDNGEYSSGYFFSGSVTMWGMRSQGPSLEVNYSGGGNTPLKWSQSMKNFNHGGKNF